MPTHSTPSGPDTVLVIDDSPANIEVLGGMLGTDYRVLVANGGERGLRLAQGTRRPDLILLDILMPGMDGVTVLRALKADPHTRDIPVIFLTALNAELDELRGLEEGAVDYITKPFKPAVVLARVRTHLELKHARDRLATENQRLDAEVLRRTRENTLIQDLNLNALAILAEIRDMETGRHVQRTQAYVALLAQQLQHRPRFREALAGPRLAWIVKASPLHDIGKIGIPDAILLKPGRLNEAEQRVMHTHAAIGAAAIGRAMDDALLSLGPHELQEVSGAFDFLRIAQCIALNHHERWDGLGYPQGLAGEAIPAEARLMTLADVYDALTCRRVYKPPVPLAQAAQEILAGRGTLFDPDVVDAFAVLQPEFEAVATRFADPANLPSQRQAGLAPA
jgi:putative two-component system response regulator